MCFLKKSRLSNWATGACGLSLAKKRSVYRLAVGTASRYLFRDMGKPLDRNTIEKVHLSIFLGIATILLSVQCRGSKVCV